MSVPRSLLSLPYDEITTFSHRRLAPPTGGEVKNTLGRKENTKIDAMGPLTFGAREKKLLANYCNAVTAFASAQIVEEGSA
jgi:hypothetical protein